MIEFDRVYSKEKLGRDKVMNHKLLNLVLWSYRKNAYQAVLVAEREKGAPVNFPEITRAYRLVTKKPLLSPHVLYFALQDYYWND